jgi:UDP-glucose 4-epimerase
MKVLVTGGAGFIGSHVVDQLRAAGMTPRIFDMRPSPYPEHADVETVVGDILDREQVQDALRGCDAVAHLAAAADVDQVAKAPADAEALNARGTLNVLEAARLAGVKRVAYASTIWVYSNADDGPVNEDASLNAPDHLYTATKLTGELYCRSYAEMYGLDCTILRFGIPYGPRARPAAVVPAFVRKALAGEPLTIAGTGEQSRRFVYVEDLADGVVCGLRPEAGNRIYNLVSNEDVSIKRIAESVKEAVGHAEIVHTEARAADFKGVEVCGQRAERELGWTARTPFAEGLSRYVTWVKQEDAAVQAAPEPSPAMSKWFHWHVPGYSAVVNLSRSVAAFGLFALFLFLLHGLEPSADDTHLIALASFLFAAIYAAVAGTRDDSALTPAGVGSFVAGLAALALVAPWPRSHLPFAWPDAALMMLTVAGVAASLALATGRALPRAAQERGGPGN